NTFCSKTTWFWRKMAFSAFSIAISSSFVIAQY
ncbi:MAG: hypothetical protein ACJAVF_001541, partial [Paraglaciecola sp.]